MNTAVKIMQASPDDCATLCLLVNGAYRGEAAKKGWTTESDLLDGIRMDEERMIELLTAESSIVLKAVSEDNHIVGCVHLQLMPPITYLGMLTVDPMLQAGGIGAMLLQAGEEWAIQQGASSVEMTVISERHSLIAWYQRKGYSLTGEERPFPTDSRFGIPKQPVHFIVMQKSLHQANTTC